ncbi:MAG TPA: dipeptidyl aminopeptidase [Gemmatimonadetes bacterium]|jgi:dipeptidyl aminopeptidase/acylaminoacyl peptidase|nr:dipeptidyl aminopeptidase [Gemmatimonadota bacterium]|tara:strand:- start:1421 stop:3649 length:2229 start_codon:yes stop_codon:yes gene_type:complete
MFKRSVFIALILVSAAGDSVIAQQDGLFTPNTALDVMSGSIADVTSDGRWLAVTVQSRRDRTDVDHMRFGDPTYVSPASTRVLLIETTSGDQEWLFGDPVQVRGLTWSPDDTQLGYFLMVGGQYQLRMYNIESGNTRSVSLGTTKEISSNSPLIWAPDGSSVLLSLRPEAWAEEARQAFAVMTSGPVVVQDSRNDFLAWDRVRNLASRQVAALVSVSSGSVEEILPEADVQGLRFGESGDFVTYTAVKPQKTAYERNEGTEYEILKLVLDGSAPESIVASSERRTNPNWNKAGDAFVYSEEGNVFLRKLEEDSTTNLTEQHRGSVSEDDSTKMSFSPMRWSPDDQDILMSSQTGWHILSPDDGGLELVLPLEEDEESRPSRSVQSWSEDGRYIYFTYSASAEWQRGLKRLDLQSGVIETMMLDENLYRSFNFSDDGGTVIYRMSDGNRPDEIWAASENFSERKQLTDLNSQLADLPLSKTELIEYLDIDGNTLYGILYYPVGYEPGRKYPLVAEIYEQFFDNGYNENMNLITAQGWFGFRPSVRFEEGFPGEAWLKAVPSAINKLVDRGIVDNDKIGVYGQSYGGYAVNLLITQTDRFAAAANVSGKVNMISFLGDSPRITTRNYRAAEIGQDRIGATLWEQPQKYIEHSAIMFADRINTPLLMLSGEGDWNVPATNQREMYYALRRLGKEVVWVNYMSGGHGAGRASSAEDFVDHWERMFDWFREYFDEGNGGRPVSQDGS